MQFYQAFAEWRRQQYNYWRGIYENLIILYLCLTAEDSDQED